MKCDGTYSCGHDGTIELFGPKSQREWKMKRHFEDICPECTAKQREEESNKAAAEAKAMGLPSLRGTEKQIAWAERIRKSWIDAADSCFDYIDGNDRLAKRADAYHQYYECLILDDRANEWIEIGSVYTTDIQFILESLDRYNSRNSDRVRSMSTNSKTEIAYTDTEKIISPENQRKSGYVEIRILNENGESPTIMAIYPKDETFMASIKHLGYRWNYDQQVWQRSINFMSAPTIDRAAEAGSYLLTKGFAVKCSKSVYDMIVNQSYVAEHKRWITWNIKKSTMLMRFEFNEDISKKVRKIGGSWSAADGAYVVSPMKYREISDIAVLYDFRISEGAKEKLDEVRKEIEGATVVDAAVKTEKYFENPLKQILESSTDVLDDLKDE